MLFSRDAIVQGCQCIRVVSYVDTVRSATVEERKAVRCANTNTMWEVTARQTSALGVEFSAALMRVASCLCQLILYHDDIDPQITIHAYVV